MSRIMDHFGISRSSINTVSGQQYNMKTPPIHSAKQLGPATASGKQPQDMSCLDSQAPEEEGWECYTCGTAFKTEKALDKHQVCSTPDI